MLTINILCGIYRYRIYHENKVERIKEIADSVLPGRVYNKIIRRNPCFKRVEVDFVRLKLTVSEPFDT